MHTYIRTHARTWLARSHARRRVLRRLSPGFILVTLSALGRRGRSPWPVPKATSIQSETGPTSMISGPRPARVPCVWSHVFGAAPFAAALCLPRHWRRLSLYSVCATYASVSHDRSRTTQLGSAGPAKIREALRSPLPPLLYLGERGPGRVGNGSVLYVRPYSMVCRTYSMW